MILRIALVCDWFLPRVGGIELHLRDLALALREAGAEAHVVTTTPGAPVIDGITVHRVSALRLPYVGMAVSPVREQIERILRRERFDVVHSHVSVFSPTAYAGIFSARALGLPTVATFHSMLYQSARAVAAADSLVGWTRNVVLTGVSSVVAAQLGRFMPDASVGVLSNGIDLGYWSATPARRPAKDVHFVTAIRLSRKKRPLELVRAFAAARAFVAGSPDLKLTIAGGGPDREAVTRLAAELGIAQSVSVCGHLDRNALRSLYGTADVFVLPSERESFGIAALEARAAGLPVIGMVAAGVRDFITPGLNGMLAIDHDELGRFIARMALEPATRALMRAHNARPPLEYDWKAVAETHISLYGAAARLREMPDAPTDR